MASSSQTTIVFFSVSFYHLPYTFLHRQKEDNRKGANAHYAKSSHRSWIGNLRSFTNAQSLRTFDEKPEGKTCFSICGPGVMRRLLEMGISIFECVDHFSQSFSS